MTKVERGLYRGWSIETAEDGVTRIHRGERAYALPPLSMMGAFCVTPLSLAREAIDVVISGGDLANHKARFQVTEVDQAEVGRVHEALGL